MALACGFPGPPLFPTANLPFGRRPFGNPFGDGLVAGADLVPFVVLLMMSLLQGRGGPEVSPDRVPVQIQRPARGLDAARAGQLDGLPDQCRIERPTPDCHHLIFTPGENRSSGIWDVVSPRVGTTIAASGSRFRGPPVVVVIAGAIHARRLVLAQM
jgi:hypothetical protein